MRSDLREYFLNKAGVYSDEQYIAFLEGNITALEIEVKKFNGVQQAKCAMPTVCIL